MNEQVLEIIQQFYKKKKKNIAFIFLGGSGCLPYISNAHDVDVLVVYKSGVTNEERHSYSEQIKTLKKSLQEVDSNVSIIKQYLGCLKEWYNEIEDSEEKDVPVVNSVPAYIYQAPHFQILCGEDSVGFGQFSVLNNKPRYIQVLKNRFPRQNPEVYSDLPFPPKSFYHVLTGLYIILNDSEELTSEQIENINIVHDGENREKITELYNWAEEELNKL